MNLSEFIACLISIKEKNGDMWVCLSGTWEPIYEIKEKDFEISEHEDGEKYLIL